MKIAIGADHAGFELKEGLKIFLEKKGYKIKDFGTFSRKRCDYPRIGYRLARAVSGSKFEKGILLCGSGIGQSIVANRVPGVRAALCHNIASARLSRQHNDANIIIFAARFMSEKKVKRALDIWLKTEFLGGRHLRRLRQIEKIEKNILQG